MRTTADWRALLDGATPGPWDAVNEYDCIVSMNPHTVGENVMWNSDRALGWVTNENDVPLAASAPEAVAEVIRLRKELEGLQKHMRYQPHNILADEVADTIRIILRGDA